MQIYIKASNFPTSCINLNLFLIGKVFKTQQTFGFKTFIASYVKKPYVSFFVKKYVKIILALPTKL